MKETIKNKEPRERQTYVPASVKVVTTSVQRVICTSPNSVNDPFGGSSEEGI